MLPQRPATRRPKPLHLQAMILCAVLSAITQGCTSNPSPEWPPSETEVQQRAVAAVEDLFEIEVDPGSVRPMSADEIREWIDRYRSEHNEGLLGELADIVALPSLESVNATASFGVLVPDVLRLPCLRTTDAVFVPALPGLMEELSFAARVPNGEIPTPETPGRISRGSKATRAGFGGVILVDDCPPPPFVDRKTYCLRCTGCEGPTPPLCVEQSTCSCTKVSDSRRCRECQTCTGCS